MSWTDQLRCYPGPRLGLVADTPQHLPHLWSSGVWRDCSCGAIAAGSPWLRKTEEYWREVLVRVQYWWCTKVRGIDPDQELIKHWTVSSKAAQTKASTAWYMIASNASKMNEEEMERQERRRSKVLLFPFSFLSLFILLLFYFILFYFLAFFSGDTTRVRGRCSETGRWVGLECMMWNTQTTN